MGYVFKSDINIEYLFYKEMISKLNGSKSKTLFNSQEKYEVICPRCKKKRQSWVMERPEIPSYLLVLSMVVI